MKQKEMKHQMHETTSASVASSKRIFSVKTITKWVGWGIVYVVAFYLGNVTGEYVAANMPVFAFKMPAVSVQMPRLSVQLPQLSVQFKLDPLMAWIRQMQPKEVKAPEKITTKTVIIAGNVLSMPVDGATSGEKLAFEQSIGRLAVAASAVSVEGVCDVTPAFITLGKGVSLQVTNKTNASHDVVVSAQSQAIPSGQTVTIPITGGPGAYPVRCDNEIVGFYLITQ